MNKNEIMMKMSRNLHKAAFQVKKVSPELLVFGGIVGVGVGTVMACMATRKIDTILDERKETVDKINEVSENPAMAEKYSEEDAQKDMLIVNVQTGVKLAKLYAPAVVVTGLSLTAILASHNILSKRNAALAAAYATIDKSFKEYKNRVIDRFGKDVEREIRYDIKAKEIEETAVDKKGKEKTVKKTVETINGYGPYSKFFDPASREWSDDPEYNLMFLRRIQDASNDMLRSKGFLFLNDVYKMLDIDETKEGQVIGWIYDPDNKDVDSYVDFGLYDDSVGGGATRRFVNGYENTVLLDFNVDGNIWDKVTFGQR